MFKFLHIRFALIILFCLFSSLSSIPQYQYSRDSNRTLSEETWHFFRNRNRQKLVTGHYDDALLLDTQKSIPSNAFHSPRRMLILLGPRFFNPHLQSVSIPREAYLYPNGELNFPNQTKVSAKLIRKRISTLKKHFNRVFKQKDIQVLSTYSTCPIIFTWKNYGEQYWPRWVREGKCIDLEEASCSLPPGMFCVGHEERTVVMLRYFCPLSEDENSCSWYRMQKPVLISCKCACR
ncbi:unnamed protein product [Hymenolepis diminuta]|uniref:Noggin n=1 Tax=Hymenolepis diminuta TaxID=6216 RepID=A0A0R3SUM9_HYMDI|nr:unnamed protein product [Hymenolepis diminuta]VUZ52485.1 unnamed protein product [Hymenolepis diminuta]